MRLLAERENGGLSASSLEVIAILAAALIAAFAFAITVSRSLQAQIQRLLDAARRMASGDFAVEVPTEGNDEFAALGTEFNTMARQLEKRLEELQLERARLREAIRRVGQSFAKGLDRDAVLEIVVQTAVDGVGADSGRAALRTGPAGRFEQVAGEGDVDRFHDVISATEAAALDAEDVVETELGGSFALSHPLRAQEGGRILGMLTAARAPRASPTPSASCSPTSPTRPASRSRTSTSTRRSSARRSPTSSPACSTTGASRRSCSRRSSGPSASAPTWA